MKSFIVYVTETNKGHVRVEAESKEDAERQVDEFGIGEFRFRCTECDLTIEEVVEEK